MFWTKKSEPLSPPLSTAPPGPLPSLPTIFLGVDEYFVEECGDVLRSDLVFSMNAKAIHPALEGTIRETQLPILNYLSGKDVLSLTKALGGGSLIVGVEEIMTKLNDLESLPWENNRYRCAIADDSWFDVDQEYQQVANNLFQMLRHMYNNGSSIIIMAQMGLFTVPRQICNMFGFESNWNFASYTKRVISKTDVGGRILGDSFPFETKYIKANFVAAPQNECLFVEHIDPADYEWSDSDSGGRESAPEPSRLPEPNTESPVVVHFGNNGCISYFGFVNSLDVSYGAILHRLANVTYGNQANT